MNEQLTSWVHQYRMLQDRIKEIQALQKPLNASIVEEIDAAGFRDDKEHMWIQFEQPMFGVRALQHQRKVKVGLDMEAAIELLKARGLSDRCLVMVPALNDDEVAAARFEDLLTDADLEIMFPKTITWALVFQKE